MLLLLQVARSLVLNILHPLNQNNFIFTIILSGLSQNIWIKHLNDTQDKRCHNEGWSKIRMQNTLRSDLVNFHNFLDSREKLTPRCQATIHLLTYFRIEWKPPAASDQEKDEQHFFSFSPKQVIFQYS